MCAIIGALMPRSTVWPVANVLLNHIIEASHERGRDGRGIQCLVQSREGHIVDWSWKQTNRYEGWTPLHLVDAEDEQTVECIAMIGNLRAEPTTEFVKDKEPVDQQPYRVGPWTIVHNGTIANDKDFRTNEVRTSVDSAAIVELLALLPMNGFGFMEVAQHFNECIAKLKGSYAILATHDEHPYLMLTASNYRPIWYARGAGGATFFASARHYFPDSLTPVMLEPYSVHMFSSTGKERLDAPKLQNMRALVVCSGGLDSVVAATKAIADGYNVELLHFAYGSRAQTPEVEAVISVAIKLGVPYRIFPLPIYKPEDSPLLQADSKLAGGEQGAEFAHEWVPARNLAMLAIATAFAEAGGYDTIVLGNNLEEAGAYPDNEPEFINRFNDLLPFAVADGKKVRVVMPVGNLMKHEIVKLGHDLGAPLDKTWSCYRAGHEHCGTCGPCYMRRTAFAINDLPEVITYANERT
jgi:7-cyano-7-deazaguanine synthase